MLPSHLKSRTVYKRLGRLFRASSDSEREMMVQVAKLCVLHEDIMLEIHGSIAADSLELGHADGPYKRVYFIRRALATAWEVRQVVGALQKNQAFKERKRGFRPANLELWERVVQFFTTRHEDIKDWRNSLAAKFIEHSAEFALDNAAQLDGSYELYRSRVPGLGWNLKLGVASTLLGTALGRTQAGQDKDSFMDGISDLMTHAHANAVFAARVIAVEFFYRC